MKMTNHLSTHQAGFALPLAITLLAVMLAMVTTYSVVTVNNLRVNKNSTNSNMGIFAAEAGMNSRAERIRQKFIGFRTPEGPGPTRGTTTSPCSTGNLGEKDMVCETFNLSGRTVQTYVNAGTERTFTMGAGEEFSGLNVIETPFTVYGQAMNVENNPEAIASLTFKSRLVPLFQFAVFFNKDLEFDNTATLSLSGPVHTNGNLFLDGSLTISGTNSRVTTAGDLYRGHKQDTGCDGTVQVGNVTNTLRTLACNGRVPLTAAALNQTWGAKMKRGVDSLTVPTIADLQPIVGNSYWDKADVRILLKQVGASVTNNASWQVSLVNANKSTIVSLTNSSTGPCNFGYQMDASGIIGMERMISVHRNFRDNREGETRQMVDVDVPKLLECMHSRRGSLGLGASTPETDDNDINDKSDDGLVVYMTVDDSAYAKVAQSSTLGEFIDNNYGFRLINGAVLAAPTTAGAPAIRGLSFVSDQATYILGDYNSAATLADGWKPSSIVADSVNMISNGWQESSFCRLVDRGGVLRYMNRDATRGGAIGTRTIGGVVWTMYQEASKAEALVGDAKSSVPLFCRPARLTSFRAAVLAGTATTGDQEGQVWSSGVSPTSGGVHNMMRFHEDWGNVTYFGQTAKQGFVYAGSLVSLSKPLHANGAFQLGGPGYVNSGNSNGFSDFPWIAKNGTNTSFTYAVNELGNYTPPNRNWRFDEQFATASNLPPLTPRFVYLKQENFTRQFSQ